MSHSTFRDSDSCGVLTLDVMEQFDPPEVRIACEQTTLGFIDLRVTKIPALIQSLQQIYENHAPKEAQ